jgi:hypothetical protein
MEGKSNTGRRLAEIAGAQHGVISRAQLAALGLGETAIDVRIARGALHPIHRGVFAAGHRVRTQEAAWMAAVLAAGPGAALSHGAAAALWRLRDARRRDVDVIAARLCRRPGIAAHRIALRPDEVTVERGIPVTTPARTLFDLATVVTPQQLEHAFNEAEVQRLASPTSLADLLARYPRRPGNVAIRRLLAAHVANGASRTRSELEIDFLTFLDTHDLPRPMTNRRSDHGELDATWPAARLVVEVDGFATHGTRRAFEADRARDRALQVDGWRVLRVTSRQLTGDPETIARQIRTLLAGTV